MQNFFEILPEKTGTAIALGYFDGLHKGHRNVISLAAAEKENGLTPVCFTFSKSPKSVLNGTQSNALMTSEDKIKTLERLGIERTYQADFEKIIAPLWLCYHKSHSRVPMTDFYDSVTSLQNGFQHRSVQGGLFIKLL